MSKIKLTKGELKRQRDSLEQFRHYLPTLQLKKQQLQLRIRDARQMLKESKASLQQKEDKLKPWMGLLADPGVDIQPWVIPQAIKVKALNIAGANIEIFESVKFDDVVLDFFDTPLWLDHGIKRLREIVTLLIEIKIVKSEIAALQKELRITTQRVNLFEKIKIPECSDNIRRIRIYLGDQQSNAVGIGKVAKKKIELRDAVASGI
ncbi:V-type ATP synthase subunit D [Candidatus Omnitrophota bacterium]